MQTQDVYVARWGSHALKVVQHPWTKCSRVPQTLWCPNHKIPQHISNHSHPWDGITTIKSHWQRSWGWIEGGSFKKNNYYYNSRELREEEKRVKTFCVLSSLLFFFAQRRKYYINRKESRGTSGARTMKGGVLPDHPIPIPPGQRQPRS